MPLSSSYRVQYELRPSKQVERRMIIDALQRLAQAGFSISDYQYTGFGSFYFVDFIMFHKLLGIHKMLSVEHSPELKQRVEFNRPFRCIRIQIGPASSVIPSLSRDIKHLLWLDYDGTLTNEHIADILSAMRYLTTGSILIITVDVEPPDTSDLKPAPRVLGPRAWKRYFEYHSSQFLPPKTTVKDFAKSRLPAMNIRVIESALRNGLAGREEVVFEPLFNFTYKDGHQMLTMGGMIASESDSRRIAGSTVRAPSHYVPYVRRNFSDPSYHIPNLKLTRKERLLLDALMPSGKGTAPKLHLDQDTVAQYGEIYRFFPAYAELLL